MGTVSPGLAGRHFWERSLLGWHAVFAAMIAVAAVAAITDSELSAVARSAVLGLCVIWLLWYFALGAPSLMTDGSPWRARLYVMGAVALAFGIAWFVPEVSWSSFVLIPQIFALLNRLVEAIAAVAALMIAYGAALFGNGGVGGQQRWALVFGLLASFGFAVIVGVWISGIIKQSSQRAGLIHELETARAELAALSHESGVAAERERLSREIHDTLAQGFTSIVLLLEAAEASLQHDPGRAREQLSLARTAARENLAESRSLLVALSPPTLREAGLVGALTRLVERLDAEMSSVATQLTVVGTERALTSATEVVLLRAAQEALTNVGKHSAASRVTVSLCFDGPATTLTVCDDGRGFRTDRTDRGLGLHGMRSRVADIDGALSISSTPGAGTTVRVSVP